MAVVIGGYAQKITGVGAHRKIIGTRRGSARSAASQHTEKLDPAGSS
jgi:hypothetical protein